MSDRPRTPYLGTYLIWLLVGIIGCAALLALMRVAFGFELSAGAIAAIPPMMAAMLVGEKWAKERGVLPTSTEAWRWSVVAAIAFLSIQILIVMMFLAAAGGPITTSTATITGMALVLFTVVVIFINRYFLVLYAKRNLKAK